MKQRRRIYYSAAQRSEIWDRWQAGEPMSSIGRRFDRESSSVFSVISPTGGIRPADRHRAKQALTEAAMPILGEGRMVRHLGEVPEHPAAIEQSDRIAPGDRVGEYKQGHVGPVPRAIHRKEPQSGAGYPVEMAVRMRHQFVGLLARGIETDWMIHVVMHREWQLACWPHRPTMRMQTTDDGSHGAGIPPGYW